MTESSAHLLPLTTSKLTSRFEGASWFQESEGSKESAHLYKRFDSKLSGDAAFVMRSIPRILLAKRLNSAHVLPLLAAKWSPECLELVFEDVPSLSLSEVRKRCTSRLPSLSIELRLALDTLAGLEALAEAGLSPAHGALYQENVLLSSDGRALLGNYCTESLLDELEGRFSIRAQEPRHQLSSEYNELSALVALFPELWRKNRLENGDDLGGDLQLIADRVASGLYSFDASPAEILAVFREDFVHAAAADGVIPAVRSEVSFWLSQLTRPGELRTKSKSKSTNTHADTVPPPDLSSFLLHELPHSMRGNAHLKKVPAEEAILRSLHKGSSLIHSAKTELLDDDLANPFSQRLSEEPPATLRPSQNKSSAWESADISFPAQQRLPSLGEFALDDIEQLAQLANHSDISGVYSRPDAILEEWRGQILVVEIVDDISSPDSSAPPSRRTRWTVQPKSQNS